jgi:hypothetical protein
MARERASRDYANSKIYIIESLEGKVYYIGSTCCDLRKRMANHRSRYLATLNGKAQYTTACEVMDYPDARMSLVEDCPCDRKEQLDAKEAHYIRHGSPEFAADSRCVNRVIPGRTRADRYRENPEIMRARARAYREANKEVMKAKAREYSRAYRLAKKETVAALNAPAPLEPEGQS